MRKPVEVLLNPEEVRAELNSGVSLLSIAKREKLGVGVLQRWCDKHNITRTKDKMSLLYGHLNPSDVQDELANLNVSLAEYAERCGYEYTSFYGWYTRVCGFAVDNAISRQSSKVTQARQKQNKIPDSEIQEVTRLYVEMDWSSQQIAEKYGTTRNPVLAYLRKHGVAIKSKSGKLA